MLIYYLCRLKKYQKKMTFDDVIGQTEAKAQLRQLITERRMPHALLFTGPRGIGKMALAISTACELLQTPVEGFTPAPNTAVMLAKLAHPDLIFSYPTIKPKSFSADRQPVSDDFAKEWQLMLAEGPYFTLSQWMERMQADNQQAIITAAESDELTRKLSLKSSQGGYKVVVMWHPERMNIACANKILKLLEEPPQQTVFILVSEEPELLLETIRSRTQRISIKRIAEVDIRTALEQLRAIDSEVAHRVARIANGSWLKALETISAGNEDQQFLDMFIMLMRQAYMRNLKELKRWAEVAAGYGREKERRMLVYFQRMVRENFIYNFHKPELNYMTVEEENFSKNFARFINEANVIEIDELLARCHRDIGQNANAKIVFYDMALKLIVLLIRK